MAQVQDEQPEERSIGKKSQRSGTNTMAYYDEFARIHFLNDARKIAKTQLFEAQKVYMDCC